MNNDQDESSTVLRSVPQSENSESSALTNEKIVSSGGENSVASAAGTNTDDDDVVQDDSSKVCPEIEQRGDSTSARGSSDISAPIRSRTYYDKETLAENYSLSYPTPILDSDLLIRRLYQKVFTKKNYTYPVLLGFGFSNFMSYAAHFCKYEARNGVEIVSVGSGNGAVDREIIATYRRHFAEEIKITLVDPNPDYEVDFKTVDDLIRERPNVVDNCIVFIIWPEPSASNDGYDIDAVRKLQPLAALTVYDPTQVSGSEEFVSFLYRKTRVDSEPGHGDDEEKFGLENYAAENVASQEVNFEAGLKFQMFERENFMPPSVRVYRLRMVKLKKKQR